MGHVVASVRRAHEAVHLQHEGPCIRSPPKHRDSAEDERAAVAIEKRVVGVTKEACNGEGQLEEDEDEQPTEAAPAASQEPPEIDAAVPPQFICPITQVIMTDPVTTADGHVYERAAIEEWLEEHVTSPITNEDLLHLQEFLEMTNHIYLYQDDLITPRFA